MSPFATNGGHRIHYTVHGDGEPVLLQHGLFESSEKWSGLGWLDAIPGSWRFLVVDSLGHGHSDVPQDTSSYAIGSRVADLVAVLDAEDIERAHVLGYSMGAWMACGMARSAPGRLRSLSLGGWDPIGGYDTARRRTKELAGIELSFEILAAAAAADPILGANVAAGDPAGFRACYDALTDFDDACPALASSGVPVFLFCGDLDLYLPGMRLAAERVPGSQLHVVSGADHISVERGLDELGPALGAFFAGP